MIYLTTQSLLSNNLTMFKDDPNRQFDYQEPQHGYGASKLITCMPTKSNEDFYEIPILQIALPDNNYCLTTH